MTRRIARLPSRLALALALAALPVTTVAAETPNFTGTWKLNREQSDDIREKMQEATSNRPGERNAPFGGPGGPPGTEHSGSRQGRRPPMMQVPETLVIAHNDPELSVKEDTGRSFTLYSDGRKLGQRTPFGESGQVKTDWEGERLVTERTVGPGGKMSETYELISDGRQLVITRRIENQRLGKPVVIRLVYDAATAEQLPE